MTRPTGEDEMRKFRKKPVVVDAVQYPCEHPALKRCDCDPNQAKYGDGPAPPQACSECGHQFIETLEGRMRVSPGDWIITGVQGEHYPCKPDIFAATYEPANTPQPPAEAQAVGDGEFGVGIQPNPKARYWQDRAEFWRTQAVALGWREKRDAANGEAPPPSAPVGVEGLLADLETIWHSIGDDKETNAAYERLKIALAQQPAADEGFTAADMMDARQEGRKEAQQPAGFSAGDMSDASAQGFRAGVESVQQPAAVDGADAHAAEIEALRADKSELEAALEYLKAHRVNASLNQDGVIKALSEVRDEQGSEIHRLRAELLTAKGQAEFYRTTRNWNQQKVERLAEALGHVKAKLEDVAVIRGAHGTFAGTYLIVTDALRDHDQEGGNP